MQTGEEARFFSKMHLCSVGMDECTCFSVFSSIAGLSSLEQLADEAYEAADHDVPGEYVESVEPSNAWTEMRHE